MKYRTRTPNVPPYHWLYTKLLHHCKRDEKQCDLTFENFLEFITIPNPKCHYCDGSVTWSKCSRARDKDGKLIRTPQSYNLDRKNNSKGYSVENCVVCCSLCNSIKGDMLTYEDMIILKEGLRKLSSSKQGCNIA
jgi:hypothetical protein